MKTISHKINLPETAIAQEVVGLSKKEHAQAAVKKTLLPPISKPLLRCFTWYARRYIRRHFHSLRIAQPGIPSLPAELPLVVYTNHASWWDPLVGLILKSELLPERSLYSPIDAAALQRYKMFAKLGFFGVEQNQRRGAVQFLRTAETILREPTSLLAVTPQSHFCDVRQRPLRFHGGLGHLAARAGHAVFLPMAVEYVFWEERLPEILVRFGQLTEFPGEKQNGSRPAEFWTTHLEEKLTAAQDELAAQSVRREPDEFKLLLRGGAGQGGVYDAWRAAWSKWRGEKFQKEHGTK